MISSLYPPISWVYHNCALLALVFVAFYIAFRVIYNLFLSPLSSIPGPWYAAVSDFWLTTHVLRLEQCKTIHQLFEKYGPVVRVGPKKVVFNDLTTQRSVYNVHKFDKSAFYKSLLTNEHDHAMTTLDHSAHSIRRKAYAPHYIPANLAKFQPEMHAPALELLNSLEATSGKAALDSLTLFRQFMVDVLTSTAYGYRLGAVSKWALGAEDPLSTAIGDFPKRGILRSAFPPWIWNLICRIPNARWKLLCDSDKIMAEFVSERVYQLRAQMSSHKLDDGEKIPMLQRLLSHSYPNTNQLMPDNDIISEAMGHMIAAADTSSTTFSYLLWELSRRPDVSKKLQAELDEAISDRHAIPDISILNNLPYLNAFIKEGLRLYTATPSLLERVVPSSNLKTGAYSDAYDLMGYALPPGTIVATQGWSMHRNPAIFPSPETFLPERWLDDDAQKVSLMNQHMMPFGVGSRVCGGQNLAQMIIRVVFATVVRNFNISAPVETNERSMDIKDSFAIFPASMECKLFFHPR